MITIQRLNEVMSQMFLSSQLNKLGWGDITNDDKQVLINKADNEINTQLFDGEKLDENQSNAFPRIIAGDEYNVDCVEKAMVQFIYDYLTINNSESLNAIQSGIQKIQVADASETYVTGSDQLKQIDRIKNTYKKYLQDYLYRGVY